MNTVRRIARNTFVLFIAQVISMVLDFSFEKRRRRVQDKEGAGLTYSIYLQSPGAR